MSEPPASARATALLHGASQRLGTAEPSRTLDRIVHDALHLPPGNVYAHGGVFDLPFSETQRGLGFRMAAAGPLGDAETQREAATRAMHDVVRESFGRDAAAWMDRRAGETAGPGTARHGGWGARFSSRLDRDGVTEATVAYEWGPQMMEALPGPLYGMARLAMEALPGLRPAFGTVHCGRSSGTQQLAFEMEDALPLLELKPLMDRLGLGHQHAGLMSTCAFLLGARFTLPPRTAMVTLRPVRLGVELRLDVNLDALVDVPPQLFSLLRMQLTERPTSRRDMERWLTALTPTGYDGPGRPSVLSVQVRPEMAARVSLFLRPALLEHSADSQAAELPAYA